MAHYAYKYACYDIDYEKYKELIAQFEKEEGREHDGDSNYDGDNWYIMAMWITQLRAENSALKSELAEANRLFSVLFDGFAVYQFLTEPAKKRTSPQNVSDTLDAVISAMK